MFSFQNLHSSAICTRKCLEYQKSTSPTFFRTAFAFIKDEITCLPEFPTLPNDCYWSMYVETVKHFFEKIVVISLTDVLENENLQLN